MPHSLKFLTCLTTAWCLAASTAFVADPGTEPDSQPVEPQNAAAMVHVPEGFLVELVAAEPDVVDPVAFTWGTDGRLWVAEMADYPMGMDGEGKPGGRIRWLRDSDGDGKYEESVVFAEELAFPNGILPWKNGVLVTAAPLILYLEDTDGDGVSDKREVLFEGFQEGNQQLRVNGLIRGLDNWIYCASGAHRSAYGADNRIKSIKTGKEIALGSRDFRFNPETGELDAQSGPSQFGRNRNDWGDWFGEMNSYPMWHYVLQDHYIRRNSDAASPDPRRQLVMPKNPKIYPNKAFQKRFHGFEQTGRFTSACWGMVYRDGLLFPESGPYTLDIFTSEPFGNLVQHNRSEPDGVSFTVSENGPVELADGLDFFASKDRWCRPVMTRTGPDGALWVADMYRYMIEHPQFLPQEGKDAMKPFYRTGDDRGRIYRVVRKDQKPRPIPNLEKFTDAELVAALETRNGWQRDTAQALLIDRANSAVIPALENMASSGLEPLARLHALYTLQGMGAMDPAVLQKAVSDSSPGVRRHAVRLSESLVDDHADLRDETLKLVEDDDGKVRMQLAYSLGESQDEKAETALGRLAFTDGTDPYMAAAIVSSVNEENLNGVLASLLAEREKAKKGGELLGPILALAVAFENREAMIVALEAALKEGQDPVWKYVTVSGLLDALDRRVADDEEGSELRSEVVARVHSLVVKAGAIAMAPEAPEVERKAAIRLLARDEDTRASDIAALASLLGLKTSAAIQVAAVSHLGSLSGKEVPEVLLAGWSSYTPSIRAEVLNVLTTRADWLTALLDAIENKTVSRGEIDAGTRQRSVTYPSKALRERATDLLPTSSSADRLAVVKAHQPALKLKGDVGRGKLVFQKVCIVCHKMDGIGFEIGPNLSSVTDRNPGSLLSSILDPNAAVEGKFSSYVASTKDGRAILGILISETGANITIRDQANQDHVILRSELVSLSNTGRSMMPDGLEAGFNMQELADLIAYVAAAK